VSIEKHDLAFTPKSRHCHDYGMPRACYQYVQYNNVS
jgi:hypothetical protein